LKSPLRGLPFQNRIPNINFDSKSDFFYIFLDKKSYILFCTIKIEKCRFLVFALSVEEAEFTAYIRRNGRMTVPKEVRDALDIEEGKLVKCKIKRVET